MFKAKNSETILLKLQLQASDFYSTIAQNSRTLGKTNKKIEYSAHAGRMRPSRATA